MFNDAAFDNETRGPMFGMVMCMTFLNPLAAFADKKFGMVAFMAMIACDKSI